MPAPRVDSSRMTGQRKSQWRLGRRRSLQSLPGIEPDGRTAIEAPASGTAGSFPGTREEQGRLAWLGAGSVSEGGRNATRACQQPAPRPKAELVSAARGFARLD